MTDHELEQHVDEARRPPAKRDPRKIGGEVATAATTPLLPRTSPEVLDASVRVAELRKKRTRERLEEKLDGLAPLSTIAVHGAKIASADPESDEVEEVTGDVHCVETACSGCGAEMKLLSEDEPGLESRAVAAGVLRRRPRGVACDDCISRAEHAAAKRQTEEGLRERISISNLDKAMQGFEFSQMDYGEGRGLTVSAARDWSGAEYPDPRGLCIFGEKGTGKTRLAATAVWQRLRRWNVAWVSWPVLLAQLGAAFNDGARAQAISVLTGKGALVLDDIAQERDEKVSDWARRQLFAAVDRRVQAGAPLLITTNLKPAEIGHVLGEKLMSRIVGYSRVLELPGRDMRLELNFDGSKTKEGEPVDFSQRYAADAAAHGARDPEEEHDG